MQKRRVVIYGKSVILGALGSSLQNSTVCDTVNVSPQECDDLSGMQPDVILFDLDAPRPTEAFSLLESQPGLKLIGVSPDTNVVKVWSGECLEELSTLELMGLINGEK